MKLLLQQVSRASVEVNGYVESRIGRGTIVYVAVRPGDSLEQAEKLAARVTKLNLWPDIGDLEKKCCTNVVDNGFEVLVVLQQSLVANFSKLEPSQDTADDAAKARELFQAFVAKLKEAYQEEMVVAAPFGEDSQVEMVAESPGLYELDTLQMAMQSRISRSAALAETDAGGTKLELTVESVTKALQRIPLLPKNKASLERSKVFLAFGAKKFRSALSDAAAAEVDDFSEALDGAAHFFTKQQQDQITAWTGLSISASAGEAEYDKIEEELDSKLAALSRNVKAELHEGQEAVPSTVQRFRPDWTGRAAPPTPGTVDRYVRPAVGFKGKGKGGGKGVRSYGIVSLDGAARLHGGNSQPYHSGQLRAQNEARFHFKQEPEDDHGKRKAPSVGPAALRLKKGMPTVAPMTPMPAKKLRSGEDI